MEGVVERAKALARSNVVVMRCFISAYREEGDFY